MIPMVIGPFIGSAVIKASDLTYVDAFGVIQSTPTPGIFLAGSIIAILAFIPLYWIPKHLKKHETNNQLENDYND